MLEYGKALISLFLKQNRVLNQPITVNVDTSNICNLSCKMCYRNESYFKQDEKRFLSVDTLEKLYSQIQPKILLLGGISAEPLMNKDIAELVRVASAHKSKVFMTTNAQLLNENMAYSLIKNGIHLIKTSIDAATPETYVDIRNSNFENLVKNIRQIEFIKRDLNIKRELVRTDFVIQPDNLGDIVHFVYLTKDLGASFASFVPVNFLQFTPETVRKFREGYDIVRIVNTLRQAKNEARKIGVKTNLADLLHGVDNLGDLSRYKSNCNDYYFPWFKYTRGRDFLCMFPWLQLAVFITGEVSMCCNTFSHEVERGLVLGNIYEDNLIDLWNGQRMQKLRQLFLSMDFLRTFKICQGCTQKLNIWYEIRMNNLFRP